MSAYPLVHSHNVLKRLAALLPKSLPPTQHVLLLEGELTRCRNDTDRELPFRQESNFYYLTACDVPGSACVVRAQIGAGEVSEVEAHLYLPEVVPEEVMWCGLPPSPDELSAKISLTSISQGWTAQSVYPPNHPELPTMIHHLPWTKPASIARINGPTITSQYLLKALHEARRVKTAREVELMRTASEITAKAHTDLMRAVGSGDVKDENAAEAVFVARCRREGAKHQAYTPIMAGGTSASVLHYISNELPFPTQEGSLILVDAGAEFNNYAADVTRCIPVGNGGKFSTESKAIYEIVLEMQLAAFEIIRPGTNWEKVQLLMHDVLIQGMLKEGLFIKPASFNGDERELAQAILASGLSSAFYPHGVGHLLGLDVHDVGGLPEGKSSNPLLRYLRLRVPLEEGFVVTVEPGLYFNEHLFAPFKNSEFVDHEKIARYWYVGGVRIEDNLLITSDGFDNLTPKSLPKTVAEIEAVTVVGA